MPSILFLHGLESKPYGTKARHLKSLGYTVFSPQLAPDFNESVEIALSALHLNDIDIIVGSSRGGAVALALETPITKVLIAPAWKKYGVDPLASSELGLSRCTILHSQNDDIIALQDSHYLAMHGASLVIVGEGHRMSDPKALEALEQTIQKIINHERLG